MSLRSFFAKHGTTPEALFAAFGVDPVLADRIDQGLQGLPAPFAHRIAEYLQVSVGDVISAAGGRIYQARAVAVGSKPR